MIIDPFLNNPKTLYYKKFMSNQQNNEILENLFEDAKESLIEKGMHLIFTNEEIEECASKIAKSKFEELPEPGDYDD